MQLTDKPNIYDDAVAYDLMFGEHPDDLSFYVNHLPKNGKRILELGCGTGRLTIPLALEGYAVTGIDIEESMLARAREKAAQQGVNIDWVHGDVRDFDLGRQFDAVLFPANSIAHMLDNKSIEACLACVRRHLTDDGRFMFQAFNPAIQMFVRDPDQRYSAYEYEDANGRGRVIVTDSSTYDRVLQINRVIFYYLFQDTQEEISKAFTVRMFFPQELDSLLRHNGFDIIAKYGGSDQSAFSSESAHQILVCRKHRI